MADEEPAENISGGADGGGVAAEFAPAEADTKAEAVVDRLGDLYWRKTYGGQDAFTCLVRTVLSQNTSDTASQPAHDALMDRYGQEDPDDSGDADGDGEADTDGEEGANGEKDANNDGEADADGEEDSDERDLARTLADADADELAETISSAGLYNQKSRTLIRLAERVVEEYDSVEGFDEFVTEHDQREVREALLDMKGVGPKTADCVLLFSGGRTGVFPVDTHVHRIYRRLGVAPPDADHEAVREVLERDLPPAKCGFGHTASIQFGREYCTARRPACLDGLDACPLSDRCDRVGVNPETDEVSDPSEGEPRARR